MSTQGWKSGGGWGIVIQGLLMEKLPHQGTELTTFDSRQQGSTTELQRSYSNSHVFWDKSRVKWDNSRNSTQYNFVSLPWKLDNPYCYTLYRRRLYENFAKSAKIWFSKTIFYVKNHRNLWHRFMNLGAHFLSLTFLIISILKLLYFLKWCPIFGTTPILKIQSFPLGKLNFRQKSFQSCIPRLKTRQPVLP